ncbi:diguanylate cyclase (GGDEF)-like protein [Actinoplanes tereljensis]|uniref:GGDEF domain-containing protein n=1 Tax=Paractinoplanes tereljensis TaxID=571912 RepID=UPI001941E9AA|nr:GGDEF domain-containing protein [Actinoplanes tereljensis]
MLAELTRRLAAVLRGSRTVTNRVVMTVAAVLVYLAVVHLAPVSDVAAGRLSQIADCASAGTMGVLWFRAARWASGRRLRIGIGLLGVAALAWMVAEAIWLVTGWSANGDVPIPAVANAFFAVTMIGTPIAVALLVRRPSASLRTLLDGLLIGTSLMFVLWALVIGPQYRAGASNLGTVTYAVVDALVVSVVVLVLTDAHPTVRPALRISAIGMVVMFAADSSYAYQAVDGHYRFGALPDLLWFLAFAILAASVPRRRMLGSLDALVDGTRARNFLPYVPFSLAFATAVAVPLARRHLDPALYWLSLALALVVVIRQLITLTENRSLTRRLSTAVQDLRFRAYHDPLTGLANRALFEDSLDRALSSGDPVAVLYIDLDGFKPINDAYGHERGDEALVVVAERLRGTARQQDVVARLGGDEFAILTVGPDPAALADRVLAALHTPLDLSGRSVSIGASIGIAAGRTTPGELLRNADAAMYAAKRQGRDRIVVFDPALWPDASLTYIGRDSR